MKVCLIMPNVFPVPATKGGATETLITNLLKENEKKGLIDFTCVSVYEEEAQKLSKDYKHTKYIYIDEKNDSSDLTFETKDTSLEKYMNEIYRKIKQIEYDFIIVEGGSISEYEYLLKNFPKEKCLVHIHGEVLGNNEINSRIYNKFIAISNYTKKLIMRDGKIPANRIHVLYNAIQLEDFKKVVSLDQKIALRKKYDIGLDDTVIFYAGRTIPQKGVKELIQSFKKLKNIHKCKLLIAGSSNYAERIKTEYDYEIEKLVEPIKDKIKMIGYVQNKELYKLHAISDIAVVPSIWEELFGLVVIEEMCSGLPLVVTKSGGIPEIVDDECAFVVEKDNHLISNLANRLDYLIENEDIRVKMGKHGKQLAQRYNMNRYLSNFYKLMTEIKDNN